MDTTRVTPQGLFALALVVGAGACQEPVVGAEAGADTDSSTVAATASSDTSDATDTDTGDTGDTGEPGLETFAINHSFGTYGLTPFEEVQPCVQWTLDNDAAAYVQAVTLSNRGYFHHSNWFVVPEDSFAGADGYFDCNERGFSELLAAALGSVLTAQSTQSFAETQRTGDGAVVKIPPRHKVIGATHMLNFGPAPIETELFMSLELIHPKDVELVLAPFRLTYSDLDIPALSESRFTGVCNDFGPAYESGAKVPVDLKLHYLLPHYHYLGNYFGLDMIGGAHDGERIFEHDGFDGEGNGAVYDPPLDLSGATGFRFTCGYDNWRDVNVGWGIGDQEMCVALALVESTGMGDVNVSGGTVAVGEQGGILEFEGACSYFIVAKNPAQSLPSQAERNGPLTLPQSGDAELPPVPDCVDHDPSVPPPLEPTLANVAAVVFAQSCTFNACHDASSPAAGLDLQSPELLTELLGHALVSDPDAVLVEPGDPEGSWLYRVLATCAPQTSSGASVAHMPLNAPILLSDGAVALVREWIAAGALP